MSIHLTTAHDVTSTDKYPYLLGIYMSSHHRHHACFGMRISAQDVSVGSSSGVRAVFTSEQQFLRTPIPFLILEGICEFERGFLPHVR